MRYEDWNNKKQKAFDALPIKFAFSEEQFDRVLREFGLTRDNCAEHLARITGNGFMLKKDVHLLGEVSQQYEEELKELLKDDVFVVDMFVYEMKNHEYQYTEEDEEITDACGIGYEQFKADKRLRKLFAEARTQFWQFCADNDWF